MAPRPIFIDGGLGIPVSVGSVVIRDWTSGSASAALQPTIHLEEPTSNARGCFPGPILNQPGLAASLLFALAEAAGPSAAGLRDALANGMYSPKVRSDFMGGVRSGVNGTPTFFINGRRHNGTYAYEDLAPAIAGELHAGASL
jgi:DSBA-like thioredoxin domain